MNHNTTIGAQIKALRKDKKYTLKQLSEATGLSIGFLSQLERGLTSIAIDSLENIATVLDVELADFFRAASAPRAECVMRSYDLEPAAFGPELVQFQLSQDVGSFDLLPRLFVLLPSLSKERSDPALYRHSGEEFIYVLEGVLSLEVGNQHYTLYPGDSVQVHSHTYHNWKNQTNKVTKILVVNTPNPLRNTVSQTEDLSPDEPSDENETLTELE